jgi:transposase-like protein
MKRILAGLATTGILAVGGIAAAGALGPAAPDGAPDDAAVADGPHVHHPRVLRGALAAAADAIGIDTDELVADLRAGASVADVAEEHGVDPDDVVAAIVDATNERLDAWQEEELPGLAEDFVRRAPSEDFDGHRRHGLGDAPLRGARGLLGDGLATAADAIGVDVEELRSALREGSTIADVARDHDVDPQAVVDAVVDAAMQRIDAALDDGIDADRAETLRERLTERVTRMVEEGIGPHHVRDGAPEAESSAA